MKSSARNTIAMRIVIAAIADRIAENSTTRKGPAKQPQQGVPTEPAVTAPAQSAQPAPTAPAAPAQPAAPAAPKKKLAVFDFDDTLVSSYGSVGVTHSDGTNDVLDSHLFALYKSVDGDSLDFTDFNDVKKPHKIKKGFDAIKAAKADPDTRVVILTARPKGASSSVKKYMSDEGLGDIETVALQSSNPMDKANWIADEVKKNGHEEVSFMDDSSKNVAAVDSIQRPPPKTLNVTNPPLPTKNDYDGEPSEKQYVSDNPIRAVSVIDKKKGVKPVPGQHSSAPKPAAPAAPAPAQPAPAQPVAQPAAPAPDADKDKPEQVDKSWWNEQSPEFKKKYIEKYPDSKFKAASTRSATVSRVAIEAIANRILSSQGVSMKTAEEKPVESNQALKDYIFKNWKKTNNPKVKKYLEGDFWEKLDSMGDFAGHWLETLEAHFEDLVKPPAGFKSMLSHFDDKDWDDLSFSLFGRKRRK